MNIHVLTMVFVCICIQTASKILKPWYACTVLDGKRTLSDVFAEFASGEIDGGAALGEQYQTSQVRLYLYYLYAFNYFKKRYYSSVQEKS